MKKVNERVSMGIPGLDEVLNGGLIPKRAYLVRGGPGAGKTTLGLHYLTAGANNGEESLFICLGEHEQHIRQNAQSLGFDLNGISFLDLTPDTGYFTQVETYDIFSPAEVERKPVTQKIIEQVEKLKPNRVFVDSMTQFRYMTTDAFQFRKQVLSFMRFLVERGATVLFTSESGSDVPDDDLMFLSDGIIDLKNVVEEHYLNVMKFRGSGFHRGNHFVRLSDTGMSVFPKLIPSAHEQYYVSEVISSGIPELDGLLHGGLERGTISLISGPSGVGKTTLGLHFMKEAARRGERSVLYAFEEGVNVLTQRCEAIGIPLVSMIEDRTLHVEKVEPLRHSPEEFAYMVRKEVEEKKTQVVMLDSIAGYNLCLSGEDLVSQMHALCKYLVNMGVTVILVNEVETITGDFRATDLGISYMADNIVFLRYREINGALKKTIGVLKKRLSNFGKEMREMKIASQGIVIGKPLTHLRGILEGVPEILEPADNEGSKEIKP